MRVETRKKITDMSTRYKGYISTKELLHEGLTNRQITASVEEGLLEKISHGHYWFRCGNYNKPAEYKALEISITAPDAVICADSACYFWGLIEKEPDSLSVATKRSDRKKIHMNFPVKRHYFRLTSLQKIERELTLNLVIFLYMAWREVYAIVFVSEMIWSRMYLIALLKLIPDAKIRQKED